MNDNGWKPSDAGAPDLDWSQVRETVRMLHLSVAQIEMAMGEGDDSINTLTDSFTQMIGNVETIRAAARELPETDSAGVRGRIEASCAAVSGQMQHAIIAFQFYDKLSQRLGHVSRSLEALAGLVGDQMRLYNPQEWRGLQQRIRSQYSMREEQAMFDALLAGASIQDALRHMAEQAEVGSDSDIELF